jgi:hypothetical protein
MSYEIPGFQISANAAVDMTTKQYCATTYTSDAEADILASGGVFLGIVQNDPEINQQATIMVDGISFCKYGGNVTAGDPLIATTGGKFITASPGSGVAIALVDGAADERGCCLIKPC